MFFKLPAEEGRSREKCGMDQYRTGEIMKAGAKALLIEVGNYWEEVFHGEISLGWIPPARPIRGWLRLTGTAAFRCGWEG